jgi:hypothetical protein
VIVLPPEIIAESTPCCMHGVCDDELQCAMLTAMTTKVDLDGWTLVSGMVM